MGAGGGAAAELGARAAASELQVNAERLEQWGELFRLHGGPNQLADPEFVELSPMTLVPPSAGNRGPSAGPRRSPAPVRRKPRRTAAASPCQSLPASQPDPRDF